MKNINLLLNKYIKKVDKNKDTLKESTKKRCISTTLKILKLHRFYNTIRKIIPQSSDSWNKTSGELSRRILFIQLYILQLEMR